MARSAFYDIKDTPEQAANLTARSMLMIAIEQRINENGWTQAEAAEKFHVNQPRVSDLLTGKINKFSLDALVNMLPAVGLMFELKPVTRDPAAARGGGRIRGVAGTKKRSRVASGAAAEKSRTAAAAREGTRGD
ncbi:MAG: helix-turn-helix domain-containing protein [Mycobacterium sp.]